MATLLADPGTIYQSAWASEDYQAYYVGMP